MIDVGFLEISLEGPASWRGSIGDASAYESSLGSDHEPSVEDSVSFFDSCWVTQEYGQDDADDSIIVNTANYKEM